MVLPCEDLDLRIETTNRQFFRVSRFEMMPHHMEAGMTNIISEELRVFKQLERLTYDLERRPDFSALALYRSIDRLNQGAIELGNLDRFFKHNGLEFSVRQLRALIRRIDTSGN